MKALALAVTLATSLVPTAAQAFCRTTTCTPTTTCPLDENGCATTGAPVVWTRAMPIVFRFQASGSAHLVNEEARAAVRAAFFRWSDVTCPGGRTSLRFVEGEDLVEDKPLEIGGPRPNPFGIYFRDRGWPHKNEGGDGLLALTTVEFTAETGRIVYADIEINTTDSTFATSEAAPGIDLQTVMTHEVGHYLGLAHSLAPNAIMAASLCSSGERCTKDKVSARRLGNDDRAAVCALFPPSASDAAPPSGSDDGGCALVPRAASSYGVAPLVMVLASLWRRRERSIQNPPR